MTLILAIFLAFFCIDFLVEFALNELNLRYVKNRAANNPPAFFSGKIAATAYAQSIEYTLAKGRFARWDGIYSRIVTLIIVFSGILPFLDRAAASLTQFWPPALQGQAIVFCLGVGALFIVSSLPTELYSTFGLEARFGFNKTTLRLFAIDKLKGLVIGFLLGIPFLWVIFWLMRATGAYWWLWAFVFVSAFQLFMLVAYPTLIAPLFNKFEPLEDGELRARILRLAHQVGFATSGIFKMDGSKRSGHSNAYFTGIGKTKRIVLFDTLLDQMTVDQGLAVLAHEMGHYKMNHIRRMLIAQTLFLLAGLYIFSLLRTFPGFFAAFGLAPSDHAAVILFTLVSGPMIFYLSPLINALSRKHEYEADAFAKQTLQNAQPMIDALVNLTVKNLSNLTPHPWYSTYHYSHPTPTERIEALQGS